MMEKYFLGIDLGASSGRHMIGKLHNDAIELEEVYRFSNQMAVQENHLVWDVEDLFGHVLKGITLCLQKYPHIESLAIDTWGVDYVLLNGKKTLYPVYAYRDSRTEKAVLKVHEKIPFSELFQLTGCQFQPFNTIYQLEAEKMSGRLADADALLMIPEYLTYRLTGIKTREYTNASTTGLCDVSTRSYSQAILEALQFPKFVSSPLSKPGTLVGDLLPDIQQIVGGNIRVRLCASHDTASAIYGIPMEEEAPYISSGTWSLLGIKSHQAVTSLEAYQANYSNEYGPTYFRVQKNIMGLWIIQCLSKETGNMPFPEIIKKASENTYHEIFDVNDPRFISPARMKEEIKAYFRERNSEGPQTDADFFSSTFHSLAFSYKVALDELEKITGKHFDKLYIIGGGAKNPLLNHLTETYTKKKVIALPIEATVLGNIKIQKEAYIHEKKS